MSNIISTRLASAIAPQDTTVWVLVRYTLYAEFGTIGIYASEKSANQAKAKCETEDRSIGEYCVEKWAVLTNEEGD